MDSKPENHDEVPAPQDVYEPPAIERVLTGEDMDREVQYAGDLSGVPSDRAVKEAFTPVDTAAILQRVARLPIETWQYKGESTRHIGPMAQDFTAAFGTGPDDRHISLIDANGVALAAIQALAQRIEAQERELAELRATIEALTTRHHREH